jgi:hypothetical protein
MKGKLVLAFGFMLFFGIVFTACGQGTANGGGEPDTQKLLGTWVDESDGSTMVFNSDGTVSATEANVTYHKYGTVGGKMALVGKRGREPVTYVFDFQISSDGKILIISKSSIAGNLLRKKE